MLGLGPGGRWFKSIRPDHYFPSREIQAERDRKLEAVRKQRQIRRQQAA